MDRGCSRGHIGERAALLVALALGCGLGEPERVVGLERLDQLEFPFEGPHLGEIAFMGDVVYVANSHDALTAVRLKADGGLEMTLDRPPTIGALVRCTTLAVHAPSKTLFCASDRGRPLAYDLSEPTVPRLRKPALDEPDFSVRDLFIDGDRLLLARFDEGLWYAEIAEDGDIGELLRVDALPANIHHVAAEGERVVALTAESELVSLRRAEAGYSVLASLTLDGPALDLSLRGERVAVALGSAGAAVVELADPAAPRLRELVTPPSVVTSADLEGDALAVIGLNGAYLYALEAGGAARLAGYVQQGSWDHTSAGAALSGRFVGGDLIVSDWSYINRLEPRLDGEAVGLELPASVYRSPGASVTVAARNPGAVSLRVQVSNTDKVVIFDELVEPGAVARVTVAPALLVEEATQHLGVLAVEEGASQHELSTSDERSVLVVTRDAAPGVRPAPGEAFPVAGFADEDGALESLPLANQRSRVMFHSIDCAAMWPVIQDAAWLARHGALDDGARVVLLSEHDIDHNGASRRWRLEDLTRGHYYDSNFTPPEVFEFNQPSPNLYNDVFLVQQMISGAAHPTDYLVGADGVVEAVEREYRGAYPLR